MNYILLLSVYLCWCSLVLGVVDEHIKLDGDRDPRCDKNTFAYHGWLYHVPFDDSTWPENFENCSDDQSPININTEDVLRSIPENNQGPDTDPGTYTNASGVDMDCPDDIIGGLVNTVENVIDDILPGVPGLLEKLKFHNFDTKFDTLGDADGDTNIVFGGMTPKFIELSFLRHETIPYIMVNGIKHIIRAVEFHWGFHDNDGTQHAINCKKYAMEVNFRFITDDEYEPDSIVYVAVLYKKSRKGTDQLDAVLKPFKHSVWGPAYTGVTYKDEGSIVLEELIPENPASYYRYNGSEPYPECRHPVTWFVLRKLMPISQKQIDKLRSFAIYITELREFLCPLANNCRILQPRNGRPIYISK